MLTVRKALTFGGLRDTTVLAGAAGLDSPVTSVSVLEVAESSIAKWVKPGELYISSFYAVTENIPMQKLVVENLYRSQCCGLVICHLGMHLKEVSAELIELCESLNFPLIAANPETPFVNIINPIVGYLLHQAETPGASPAQPLYAILAEEKDPYEALKKIAISTGCEITFLSRDGECLFSNKSGRYLEQEKSRVRGWVHGSAKGRTTVEKRTVYLQPVVIKSEVLGLLVIEINERAGLTEAERVGKDILVPAAIVMNLLASNSSLQTEEEQTYMADLLSWNFPSMAVACERGKRAGFDIENKNSLILLNINAMQHLESEQAREMANSINKWFVPAIKDIVHRHSKNSIVFLVSDTLVIILENKNNALDLKKIARALKELFRASSGTSLSIGISRWFADKTGIPQAYREAFEAAILGREIYGPNRICSFDDMFFYSHIKKMRHDKSAVRAAEAILEPVLRYDEKNHSALLETMGELFLGSMNIAEAAKKMFRHRNTILYRKNKINELLRCDAFSSKHGLQYFMAYYILKKQE